MSHEDPDSRGERFSLDRRTLLTIGAGAAAGGLGVGFFSGNAAAWHRFDVEFRSASEVWMIVANDLDYDPPAVTHVIVDTGDGIECRLVEFTHENAMTVPERYGDYPVVPYDAADDTLLGVLPYNRPFPGDGRFSRPRCVLKNGHLPESAVETSVFHEADCVRAAMEDHWDGRFRECWFDPLDGTAEPGTNPVTSVVPADPRSGQLFGHDSAFDRAGDLLVVGAPGDDENGADSGAAYVFSFQDAQWTQVAKLQPADATGGEAFGRAVDVNAAGDVILIGAPAEADSGAAYVFGIDDGGWHQTDRLEADDPETSERFGRSVALDAAGTYALVGAQEGAYGFVKEDSWMVRHKPVLDRDTEWNMAGDRWGRVVTLDDAGQTAIMANTTVGFGFGEARLFTRGSDGWSHQGLLGRGVEDHYYGADLDITGDGGVGLLGTDVWLEGVYEPQTQGYAEIVSTTSGEWDASRVTLVPDDGLEGDHFGRGVAIDDAASTVLVGAPLHDPDGTTNAGAAYLYTRDGDTWDQIVKIVAADVSEGDTFGESVALDSAGDRGVVGAPFAATDGTASGTVYVIDIAAL